MQLSENHLFFDSVREIKNICKPLLPLGIDHFSFTRNYQCGQRVYLTTHANLLQSYFSNDLYLIGSCELKPQNYHSQFYVWSSLPQQQMYADARHHGFSEGILITNPLPKCTEFYNFSTSDKHKNIANIYLSNFESMNMFMQYFKSFANTVIAHAENAKFYLPHQNDKANFLLPGSIPTLKSPLTPSLPQQQYQCAIRLIKGISFKQIAKEMKISPRTVETYVENMKYKFHCDNKTALAVYLSKLMLGIY